MIRQDPYDNSLVIEGFQNGIADSPFDGIADMRNVNIISVPGEASVNFATSALSTTAVTGTVVSANTSTSYITLSSTSGLENGMALSFAGASLPVGISTTSTYWVTNLNGAGNGTLKLLVNISGSTTLAITDTGTGTFSTYTVNKPQHFTTNGLGQYWMIDKIGQVWSNLFTAGTNGYWVYLGNRVPSSTYTNGNGIAYYKGYLFVFHNSSIDYTAYSNINWIYGWNPALPGAPAGWLSIPTGILNSPVGLTYSHETYYGQDDVLYYCDSNYVGSWRENTGSTFDPSSASTFTFAKQALALPAYDLANCLAELGVNLLVGGIKNAIYPWNRTSTSFTYPILLAESVISKMVTVNTNTYILVGNRGRIYITNGSQAILYKKVPDHISATVEPYFTWGGAMSNKNQLFFSLSAKTNAGTAIAQYGGIWAIDLDTKAIRLTNKLSNGVYAGLATALIPIIPSVSDVSSGTNPAGTGFYAGWDNGSSAYGIDQSSSTPYTGSQAVIESDLIPVGTYQKPRDFTRVEFRLTKPLVSGESVTISYRTDFSQTYTDIFTDSTAGNYSYSQPVNFKNAQWLQLKITLNSTASTPSYTRLKEIRILF